MNWIFRDRHSTLDVSILLLRGRRGTSDVGCVKWWQPAVYVAGVGHRTSLISHGRCSIWRKSLVRGMSFCVAGRVFSFSHSTLHALNLYFTFHTLHFTLQTLHFTVHTPHSALYTPHSTLYTPNFTLYTLHSTLYTLQFTLHTPLITLYALHRTFPTQHCTFFTLHTLHSTPFHIPQSTVHWCCNREENRTKLFRKLCFIHESVLHDCIRVRWFLLFFCHSGK